MARKKKASIPPDVREYFVLKGKEGYKKRMSGKTKAEISASQSKAGKNSWKNRKKLKVK